MRLEESTIPVRIARSISSSRAFRALTRSSADRFDVEALLKGIEIKVDNLKNSYVLRAAGVYSSASLRLFPFATTLPSLRDAG